MNTITNPDSDSNREVFKQAVKDFPFCPWAYILLFMVICSCVERRYGVWGWIGMIIVWFFVTALMRMNTIRKERREAIEAEEDDGESGFAPDKDDDDGAGSPVTVKKQGLLSWFPYFIVFLGAMLAYQGLKVWKFIKA